MSHFCYLGSSCVTIQGKQDSNDCQDLEAGITGQSWERHFQNLARWLWCNTRASMWVCEWGWQLWVPMHCDLTEDYLRICDDLTWMCAWTMYDERCNANAVILCDVCIVCNMIWQKIIPLLSLSYNSKITRGCLASHVINSSFVWIERSS